jgi:hypothetical protein
MRRFPPIAFAATFLLTAITLSADPAPAPEPVGIVFPDKTPSG